MRAFRPPAAALLGVGDVCRLRRGLVVAVCVVVITLLGVGYLYWTPPAPDLAAQVARARQVSANGVTSWSTTWFAGVFLPNYSVITPATMAALGTGVTGLLALAAGGVAAVDLTRDTLRPRAAAAAAAAVLAANLLDGRITFAVGVATASIVLPGTGVMPFSLSGSVVALTCGVAVYACCPSRLVRTTLILVAMAVPVMVVVPNAVGYNITRIL